MPFLGNSGPLQILLILVVILLIFGATRLPALAKSMGQSARAFKSEMKQMRDDDGKTESTADPQSETKTEQQAPPSSAESSPGTDAK